MKGPGKKCFGPPKISFIMDQRSLIPKDLDFPGHNLSSIFSLSHPCHVLLSCIVGSILFPVCYDRGLSNVYEREKKKRITYSIGHSKTHFRIECFALNRFDLSQIFVMHAIKPIPSVRERRKSIRWAFVSILLLQNYEEPIFRTTFLVFCTWRTNFFIL